MLRRGVHKKRGAKIMLNAAVIGLGWWGKHIINCLEDSDRIKIVQTMDVSSNEAGKFASEKCISFTTDFQEVLKNPNVDSVIVVTPHTLHEEQVVAAAKAGKQIFCEKPFSLTKAVSYTHLTLPTNREV